MRSDNNVKNKLFNIFRRYYYNNQPRHNICDLIFVSGKATKNVLINDGVDNKKIISTGLPRFKYLFLNKKMKLVNKKLLILLGANSWHGYGKKLILFERLVVKTLIELFNNNHLEYSLCIRPHPRGDSSLLNDFSQYSDDLRKDVNSSILESSAVFSIGYPSTSLFEGKVVGKETYLIKSKDLVYDVLEQEKYENTIINISLNALCTNILDNTFKLNNVSFNYIDHFIDKNTVCSDTIIAKNIVNLI